VATARGVSRFDKTANKWLDPIRHQPGKNDGPRADFVRVIAVDSSGAEKEVWMGTPRGLSRWNLKTKKWLHYNTAQGDLKGDDITAIAIGGKYVWVGTKYNGLSRYDKVANSWGFIDYTSLEYGNEVTSLDLVGDALWIGTGDGLTVFNYAANDGQRYGETDRFNSIKITAVAWDGDYVWVGTEEGLNVFDTAELMVTKIYSTSNGLGDKSIEKIRIDGQKIWVTTFGGISVHDKSRSGGKAFRTILKTDLKINEESTTALAIDGNYLWVGTDGGGVARLDKEEPQVAISGDTAYKDIGLVSVRGTIFHYLGIASYKVEVKNIQGEWTTDGITNTLIPVRNAVNEELAIVNTKDIFDGPVDVRLTVTDKKGRVNTTIYPITVDNVIPKITINNIPKTVKTRNLKIKGTFEEVHLRAITFNIKGSDITTIASAKASPFGAKSTFEGSIKLNPGINTIVVTIEDTAKHKKITPRTVIFDNKPPIIKITSSMPSNVGVSLFPIEGTIQELSFKSLLINQIPLKKDEIRPGSVGIHKFKTSRRLNNGRNQIVLVAMDEAGYKTTKTIYVRYDGNIPYVKLSSSLRSDVSVTSYKVYGLWSDKNIDKIILEPGGVTAKIIPGSKPGEGEFTGTVILDKPKNVVKVTAYNKKGGESFDLIEVNYSSAADQKIAGSIGTIKKVLTQSKQLKALSETNRMLLARISALEKELRERPTVAGGTTTVKTVQVVKVEERYIKPPKGNALFLAPYRPDKGDDLWRFAERYLGDPLAFPDIARFNDEASENPAFLKKNKKLIIPTKGLVKSLSSLRDYEAGFLITDAVAETYHISGAGKTVSYYGDAIKRRLENQGLSVKIVKSGKSIIFILPRTAVFVISASPIKINLARYRSAGEVMLFFTLGPKIIRVSVQDSLQG